MDEPQRAQITDLPFIDRGLKREVKLFKGLHKRQVRQLQPGLQVPLMPRTSSSVKAACSS